MVDGSRTSEVRIVPLMSLGRIGPGDDLAEALADAVESEGLELRPSDILVVSHKIVSKAEARHRRLEDVSPSDRARELAEVTKKDPRLIELVLSECRDVLRAKRDVIVVETRLGHIVANAGIDRSNTGSSGAETYVLLPEDPDASARAIRQGLAERLGSAPGVIVSDSFGRPWRLGTTGVAIGTAGPAPLVDLRGRHDMDGKRLETSEVAFADSVASAAVMVMGEADEACPAAIVRGLSWNESHDPSTAILRPADRDMFR